ncbi:NAD(P)-binding protein [Suillus ampliporus]|nr:NAD(P)-binding protein [Suillus ampliporus]
MADSATSAQTNQPHVALITGAAQGIGRAIALRLAEDGLDIAIADLKSQRASLDGVADEVRTKGRRCIVLECDVSQENEVQRMVEATEKEFDALDVMVANAGRIFVKSVVDSTLADFDRIFDTNVRGTFLCLRAAAQAMIRRGRGGRIISASSVSGKKGMPLNSIYCASKSAIRSFTQALAGELGAHNITVNAYAPGPVDTLLCMFYPMLFPLLLSSPYLPLSTHCICTPMLTCTCLVQGSLEELAKQIGLPDGNTFIQGYQANAALKRIGTPEDIANMVSFLAGKDSSYITGQTITIDGGLWMD